MSRMKYRNRESPQVTAMLSIFFLAWMIWGASRGYFITAEHRTTSIGIVSWCCMEGTTGNIQYNKTVGKNWAGIGLENPLESPSKKEH